MNHVIFKPATQAFGYSRGRPQLLSGTHLALVRLTAPDVLIHVHHTIMSACVNSDLTLARKLCCFGVWPSEVYEECEHCDAAFGSLGGHPPS